MMVQFDFYSDLIPQYELFHQVYSNPQLMELTMEFTGWTLNVTLNSPHY